MIPVATGGPLESCFIICSHLRFATEVVITRVIVTLVSVVDTLAD